MISSSDFKQAIKSMPLITIDFICSNAEGEILLGKRINKPAQGYYFTPGGRIFKNEKTIDAISRLAKKELGIEVSIADLKFNGIYDHFFSDSIFDTIDLHCVNIAFEYDIKNISNLPYQQHEDYHFFSRAEIAENPEVHEYVQWYFEEKTPLKTTMRNSSNR